MAKKRFDFNYDFNKAEIRFIVDLDNFTPEMAYSTLTFFTWDYDHEADPIEEVMKKYAMAVLLYSIESFLQDAEYMREHFSEEGFGPIDGSIGITLLSFEPFGFEDNDLEMEVQDA